MTHVPAIEKRTWDLTQTDIKARALSFPCRDRDPGLIHSLFHWVTKLNPNLSHMSSYLFYLKALI